MSEKESKPLDVAAADGAPKPGMLDAELLADSGHQVRNQLNAVVGAAGLLSTASGLLGPIDTLSTDLMSAHMAQHLLIADVSAPLILVGLRTPVLQHMLPPPVLVPLARQRWLRRQAAGRDARSRSRTRLRLPAP